MADWTAGSPSGPLSASRYGAPSAPRTSPGGLSGASRPGAYPFAQRASAALAELDGWQGMGRARMALWAGGGALSLALVAGVGIWGYKLVLREVLGVPVVAVAEGPMRVAPAEPGGAVAAHQGLAVNAVAAAGEAEAPSDVLTLAPAVPALAPEDMTTVQTTAEADEPAAAEAASLEVTGVMPTSAPPATMTAEQVQAFADQIAAGAAPLSDLAAPAADAAAATAPIPASVPGVATAMRPPARPSAAVTLTASAPIDPALVPQASGTSAAAPAEVPLTADIAAGTSLVQLGAFDSPEVAAAEWDRLSAEFADFIGGRERVIQEAESGGRTFFRLRATGFADLGDARRFCAALVAEDAGCIPVVVN